MSKIIYTNRGLSLTENIVIASCYKRRRVGGGFDFLDNVVKVEFTFGYKLNDGKLVIDLHHSSLPFSL